MRKLVISICTVLVICALSATAFALTGCKGTEAAGSIPIVISACQDNDNDVSVDVYGFYNGDRSTDKNGNTTITLYSTRELADTDQKAYLTFASDQDVSQLDTAADAAQVLVHATAPANSCKERELTLIDATLRDVEQPKE